ncbi:MAG: hypothetical protein ACTSQO_07590 [Candidatus Helarchaeota archaeon]
MRPANIRKFKKIFGILDEIDITNGNVRKKGADTINVDETSSQKGRIIISAIQINNTII